MNDTHNERVSVTVQVMGKPLTLRCSVDERPALLDSANLLNEEMQKLAPKGSNSDYEKIAVVSALNLADEVLKLRVSSQEPPRSALSQEVVAKAQATLKAVAEFQSQNP